VFKNAVFLDNHF